MPILRMFELRYPHSAHQIGPLFHAFLPGRRIVGWGIFLLVTCLMTGCAAFRPMDGVPARFVPDELQSSTRDHRTTIDWTLLGQEPPEIYRIDSGDVLGVYIDGILDTEKGDLPIYHPTDDDEEPSLGYPIKVREDGTISLPENRTLDVRNLSIKEVEHKIRDAYTLGDKPLLQPGKSTVMVSLQRKRRYRVIVMRQERNNSFSSTGLQGSFNEEGTSGGFLNNKRGMGRVIELPAYKNDVLHAISETGGPPGEDAENTIYVIRHQKNLDRQSVKKITPQSGEASDSGNIQLINHWGHSEFAPMLETSTINQPKVIKIPIRIFSGEQLDLSQEDITLYDGDVVYIEHRAHDVFFTGGLLGGGIVRLPRDWDLDVLEAISLADDPGFVLRKVGGPSSLNRDVTVGASNLIVVRQQPDGTQFRIKVDLDEALRNPAERIRIQEGDFLFLQYTKKEAVCAFFERHFLDWSTVALAVAAFR